MNVAYDQDTVSTNTLVRFREQVITKLPDDLYIPPDALLILLEAFEGPLDLLLYIIKKHNMDILDIPMADITKQYILYVDVLKGYRLELAGDYLVMAATLAEIKSRMLLPRTEEELEEGIDPRADLVRKLQDYERYRAAAQTWDTLPRVERDIYLLQALPPDMQHVKPLPDVDLQELLAVLRAMLKQADLQEHHFVQAELLSIREKMSEILDKLQVFHYLDFTGCFDISQGRLGVVVSFIAVLELLKQGLIDIVRHGLFSPIHLKAVNRDE